MLRQSHPRKKAQHIAHVDEKTFQAAVIALAQRTGWLTHHEYDSRRSTPGYPDLTLVRGGRLLKIELKTARGRIRPEQRVWLTELSHCSGVEVAVWRPADMPTIEAALIRDQRLPQFTPSW